MASNLKMHMDLRSRIVAVLLAVSLLPIILMGAGAWIVFGRLLERNALELQRSVVENHAFAIESYLERLLGSLQLLAGTSDLNSLKNSSELKTIFAHLNDANQGAFEDLGVIGPAGEHLAYAGPYELMDRNYRTADWFQQVMAQGTYISDVFLGYRQVPHCIIAVKSSNGGVEWILRATINSQKFDRLVHTGALGQTGDVFIINREGVYQTTSQTGDVLALSEMGQPEYFEGLKDVRINHDQPSRIQVMTWINQGHWLLVARQEAGEILAPLKRAMTAGAIVVLIAFGLTALTTFLATRHLTNLIDKANARREEIFKAFMRSAKLASLGELATGLAHEINNPLAVIAADQVNIADIVDEVGEHPEDLSKIHDSLRRIKRQVERCKSITTKMLQFGRKRDIDLHPTNIESSLREIVNLMERQARVRDVMLTLEVQNDIPQLAIDEIELEQLVVNLITNSLQAMPKGGAIRITAQNHGQEVRIEVKDDGVGIAPADLERIFEPFYTTKPVGEGTGLGLSVCYGIAQSWGGRLEASSELEKGTTMSLTIPVKRPGIEGLNKG